MNEIELNFSKEPGGFTQAKNLVQEIFENFQRQQRLPAFYDIALHAICSGAAPSFRPYLFAYAARSLLQNPKNWERENGEFRRITKETSDQINNLCTLPIVTDDRNNYYLDIVRGISLFSEDMSNPENIRGAFRHFASAARFPDFYRVVKDDFGGGASFARSFPDSEALGAVSSRRFANRLAGIPSRLRDIDLIFSVHVDRLYAQAFATHWMETIRALRPQLRCALHLHIIHRDTNSLDVARTLCEDAINDVDYIIITQEISKIVERAYFASSRIIYGASILESFQRPVIFVDADAEISNLDEFRNVLGARLLASNHIVGLLSVGPWQGYLPWRRFSAGWLYVPYTAEGLHFMASAGQFVEYFWDDRPGRNWWIDQMALEAAIIRSRLDGRAYKLTSWEKFLPNTFKAFGEDRKISELSRVPQINALMSRGATFWQALHQLNSPQRKDEIQI